MKRKMLLNLLLIASGLGILFPEVVAQTTARLLEGPSSPVVDIDPPPAALVEATEALALRLQDSPDEAWKIQGFFSTLASVIELGGITTTYDVFQINEAATQAMGAYGVEFLSPINQQVDNVIRASWSIEPDAVIPNKLLTTEELQQLSKAYLACEYAVRKAVQ